MLSTSSAAASLLTVLSLALSPPGESQGSSEPEEASSLAPAADLGLVEGPATETSGSTSASVQGEELPKMDPKNRAMVLGGDVLVAAGVGSFLASVVGAALRADARERITYTLDDPERMQERADLEQRERTCLLYTSPSPRDQRGSRMPSSA